MVVIDRSKGTMAPDGKGRGGGKGRTPVNAACPAGCALIGRAKAKHLHALSGGAVKTAHHRDTAQGIILVGDAVGVAIIIGRCVGRAGAMGAGFDH